MKWWYWILAAGAVFFITRPAEAAGTQGVTPGTPTGPAYPEDAADPIGPRLSAYMDAIALWWVNQYNCPQPEVIYQPATGKVVTTFAAGTKDAQGNELISDEQPWTSWYKKLFDLGTCEESAPGTCRYGVSGFGLW